MAEPDFDPESVMSPEYKALLAQTKALVEKLAALIDAVAQSNALLQQIKDKPAVETPK